MRGFIQAVLNIGIPILDMLIWACPNLIFSKTETTVKHNSSFSERCSERHMNIITKKYKVNVIYSLYRLLNDYFGTSLFYNLVG